MRLLIGSRSDPTFATNAQSRTYGADGTDGCRCKSQSRCIREIFLQYPGTAEVGNIEVAAPIHYHAIGAGQSARLHRAQGIVRPRGRLFQNLLVTGDGDIKVSTRIHSDTGGLIEAASYLNPGSVAAARPWHFKHLATARTSHIEVTAATNEMLVSALVYQVDGVRATLTGAPVTVKYSVCGVAAA